MSVLLMYQLVRCQSTPYAGVLSIWDVELWLRADTSGYYCIGIRKSLLTCIQMFCTLEFYLWFTIKSSDIRKCLRSSAGCFPGRDYCVLSNIYSCVLSVGFCQQFSCGVNVYRFPSWVDEKRCKSLLSFESILFLFYVMLYIFNWESSCLLIAEWILEWKHRNGCFLMWCRFSSIRVSIVNFLHYRGHL